MSNTPNLSSPIGFLKRFLSSSLAIKGLSWLSFRQRRCNLVETDITLKQRSIFIFLTWNGARFLVIVLILLLGAINYDNNMALLMCFWLASITLVSMIHTYRNLLGLKLQLAKVEPVFVGQELYYRVRVSSKRSGRHDTIRLQYASGRRVSKTIEPGQEVVFDIPIEAKQRGLFQPDRIKIFTTYPFGFFTAWSWIKFTPPCLIYPKPAIEMAQKPTAMSESEAGLVYREGNEDFLGLRAYHPGDSLKHIAWKAVAREEGVLTKQFVSPASDIQLFSWDGCPPDYSVEQRLSLLCRAVVDADKAQQEYGIQLPSGSIQPGQGDAHKHRCLSALALYDEVGHV